MTPDDGRMDGETPALNPSGPELLYMQIADHIAAQIQHGTLAPGQRLPAERDLADVYGVAYLTIRRATRELRERGLVRSVHGKGTFVAAREPFVGDKADAPNTSEEQADD